MASTNTETKKVASKDEQKEQPQQKFSEEVEKFL